MILITGGLGHIGSATVQALLDSGEECVLVQRRSPAIPEGRFSAPVTAVQADVKDLDALRAIGRGHAITGVVHMAGSMPWPPNPDEEPVEAARDALSGLFNIIEVAQEWGVKRVSLASTIGVYGGLSSTGARGEELPTTASTSATSTTSAAPSHCCRPPTSSRTRRTTSARAGQPPTPR